MKVLLINGSPHKEGCTYTALSEIAKTLAEEGVDSEIAWIGRDMIRGCQACVTCKTKGNGRCVFDDDVVNSLIEKAAAADGLIVGSPVYYSGSNGALNAILDRMFYAGGGALAFKPAAAIASARRAGTTATIERLNQYFAISNMPIVSSTYWNMVHGNAPEEVLQDAEGLQTMRNLARNMAWMLRCIEAGKAAGCKAPVPERGNKTNFIR